jgi:predicted transcriptional regulator
MTKVFVDNDEDLRHNGGMATRLLHKTRRPTEGELAILRVLWEAGPQPVSEIKRVMDEVRPTGYTTVLKLLQIMTGKGLVDRDESRRPQVYRAKYSREQTQRQLLRDLLQRAFGGSVKDLVLQALATKKSPPEELEAIEKLLDRMEGGAK